MDTTIYISFAIAPVLIIMGFIILNSSRFNNWASLRNVILFGFISVIFVVLVKYLLNLAWNDNFHGIKRTLFYVVIGLAFTAELFKYLALRLALPKLSAIQKPIDGIIYGTFAGLGFSVGAVVLLAYKFIGLTATFFPNYPEYFYILLYTYPFASAVFGVAMGYFIGTGKLKKSAMLDHITALAAATFFHSLYYFSFITHDNVLIGITALGFILIIALLISQAIKIGRRMD